MSTLLVVWDCAVQHCGSLAEGMGHVWGGGGCVWSRSCPCPHCPGSLGMAQGDAHLGRGGFPPFFASPVTWSKVLPAPVV